MNHRALRKTLSKVLAVLGTAASAAILGSCGGGGAGSSNTGSALALLPSVGTFYAGVPYDFTVAGGVVPYLVSSSEPTMFPVPRELSGHTFTVIPNNPGVVDANLQAGALQGRTVIIQVRDKNGAVFNSPSSNGIFVAQNFFTGYGAVVAGACTAAGGATPPPACAGSDSIVTLTAITNGGRFGNRQFRFEVVRGPFKWVECSTTIPPANNVPALVNTINCTSDHTGTASVRLRVDLGVTTQVATFRVVDVASGVTTTQNFLIGGGAPPGNMTLIPEELKFTGTTSLRCGSGSGTILVFDGQPPYTAQSSSTAFATQVTDNQVVVTASGQCQDGASIIILDAQGRRATAEVTSEPGTLTPPAVTVSPTTADLNNTCGFSTSVAAIGGVAPLVAVSSHPRLTVLISGSTVSIRRAATGDGATVFPTTATVSLTDGAEIVDITVSNIAANCP